MVDDGLTDAAASRVGQSLFELLGGGLQSPPAVGGQVAGFITEEAADVEGVEMQVPAQIPQAEDLPPPGPVDGGGPGRLR